MCTILHFDGFFDSKIPPNHLLEVRTPVPAMNPSSIYKMNISMGMSVRK